MFSKRASTAVTFNGLANMNATLGSYSWLRFITFGLPPNKKRLAFHGAQVLGQPEDGKRKWLQERRNPRHLRLVNTQLILLADPPCSAFHQS